MVSGSAFGSRLKIQQANKTATNSGGNLIIAINVAMIALLPTRVPIKSSAFLRTLIVFMVSPWSVLDAQEVKVFRGDG